MFCCWCVISCYVLFYCDQQTEHQEQQWQTGKEQTFYFIVVVIFLISNEYVSSVIMYHSIRAVWKKRLVARVALFNIKVLKYIVIAFDVLLSESEDGLSK